MVIYHFFYDLNYFNAIKIPIHNLGWELFAHSVAFSFIFISGIALSLSSTRSKLSFQKFSYSKYLLRGAKVFSYGLIITLVTWFFIPRAFIVFGVLHFIGVSIILSIPFLDKIYLNILTSIPVAFLGFFVNSLNLDFHYLIWLGLRPSDFYSVDYFPVLPWFAVTLLGIAVGNIFYPNYQRKIKLPELGKKKIINKLNFLGKKSLLIYFLHQPIIISLLILLGIIELNYLLRPFLGF